MLSCRHGRYTHQIPELAIVPCEREAIAFSRQERVSQHRYQRYQRQEQGRRIGQVTHYSTARRPNTNGDQIDLLYTNILVHA
jgi:hypothetical protein